MASLALVLRELFALAKSAPVSPAQAEAEKWLDEFRKAYTAGDLDHAAGALTQLGRLLHKK